MSYLALFIALNFIQLAGDLQLSQEDLLKKLESSQSKVSKRREMGFVTRTLSQVSFDKPKSFKQTYEFCTDGTRHYLRRSAWLNTENPRETASRIDRQDIQLYLKDIKYNHQIMDRNDPTGSYLMISDRDKPEQVARNVYGRYEGGATEYCIGGDNELSFLDIIKEAKSVKVSYMENDEHFLSHYKIDANTQHGRYQLWVDPTKEYQVSRVEITKEENDLFFGKPLKFADYPDLKQFKYTLDNIKYEKIDGIHVAMSSRSKMEYVMNSGVTNTDTRCIVREKIELNPDFEAIGVFEPTFGDGTPVAYVGDKARAAINWKWENGKVIPDYEVSIIDSIDEMTFEMLKDDTNSEDTDKLRTEKLISDNNETSQYKDPCESSENIERSSDIETSNVSMVSKTTLYLFLLVVCIGLPIVAIGAWHRSRKNS